MNNGPQNAEWTPHMWEGFGFSGWWRMLRRNRFGVHPRFLWVAAFITVFSTIHSVCWLIQEAFFRHRVRRVRMPSDPVFILGHWRTGTTFLHELLIRDPRHAFATTCQCMEPNCFLLIERFMSRFGSFLMPKRRPMDDLATGWDRPQEDEFALCMMGQPSFYTHIAFPCHRPVDFAALDFKGVSDSDQREWRHALAWFLDRVSFRNPGKRLVLKSPPHTARIPALLQQYPNAKFVYIARDPYRVFPSTIRLWTALSVNHTLQVSDLQDVESLVLEAGQRLYQAYESARHLIPKANLYELRYEDLMADPMGRLEQMYRSLNLGDFQSARSAIAEYLASQRDYRPASHDVSEAIREKVDRHWDAAIQQFQRLTPATPRIEPERPTTIPAVFPTVDAAFSNPLVY